MPLSELRPQGWHLSLQHFDQAFALLHVSARFLFTNRRMQSESNRKWGGRKFRCSDNFAHLQLHLQRVVHLIHFVHLLQQPAGAEELWPETKRSQLCQQKHGHGVNVPAWAGHTRVSSSWGCNRLQSTAPTPSSKKAARGGRGWWWARGRSWSASTGEEETQTIRKRHKSVKRGNTELSTRLHLPVFIQRSSNWPDRFTQSWDVSDLCDWP